MNWVNRVRPKSKKKLNIAPARPGQAASGAISQLARGSPARQAEVERQMRAAAQKQAQLYGTTGRADVAAAKEAKLGSSIRQQQAVIAEESRRASIPMMMEQERLQSQLQSARVNRGYTKALTERMKPGRERPKRRLRRGVKVQGGGFGFSYRNPNI